MYFMLCRPNIYPKHLTPTFKKKNSHKQNIHNPKPKKHKHETTWEESYKAWKSLSVNILTLRKIFNKENIKLIKKNMNLI